MTDTQDRHATASRDLFFRVADRLQLESCLHAVTQECKSLVLSSDAPALLDHYGQMLVQRLRQRLPDTSTEVFFPTHTDALIARFNELLEHLSVDSATQLPSPCAPEKLWIVHDASALPEHELKLLLRLLQQFPGARVCAVLMLGQWPQSLRGLDPQGRRIVRWEMEAPGQAQVEQFMAQARELGREVAALELVSRVYATGARPAASPPPLVDAQETAAAPPQPTPATVRAAPTSPAQAKPATPAPSWRQKPTQWLGALPRLLSAQSMQGLRQQGRWIALGVALLGFSVAVALWLQPKSAPTQPQKTAATVSTPNVAASSPQVAREEIELPEIAQQGLAWLRGVGPGVFVVEHGLFATAQDAQKKIGNGRLYGARVLPHYRDGAETAQFMVITGPYPNEDRARSFIQRVDPSAKAHPSATLLSQGQLAGKSR